MFSSEIFLYLIRYEWAGIPSQNRGHFARYFDVSLRETRRQIKVIFCHNIGSLILLDDDGL